ncbi:MAG: 1-deoxy-D-xylulose-5-phosphate reductoisomerase [Lachnospiraceae bacterium]|nr:1-deoxy-D-xylulose-5-phosphate reductoisomerase [Lachnospiraceae bacterium]
MKRIAVLGSTGSIGTQTLSILRENPDFKAVSLAANRNIDLLEQQAREFSPELVAVYDIRAAKDLQQRLKDTSVRVVSGMEGLIDAAVLPSADTVLGAVVGMIGIRPTVEAIKAGKDIALANKETLVTAGHLIMPLVKEHGVRLLPVDSEHSAIFQCFQGEAGNAIRRILLTASGGPFYGYTKEQLRSVTLEQTLKHPNWSMGKKVTIDSASLINKGLEVMEAHWLFHVPYDRIQVLVEPTSTIHSMVEFTDGAVKAELSVPDMRLAILYALTWPKRRPLTLASLDFDRLKDLRLRTPDYEAFPGLKMAYAVGRKGGNAPTVFNAANEFAVSRFLKRELAFHEIPEVIEKALSRVRYRENPDLSEIFETEQETYEVLR